MNRRLCRAVAISRQVKPRSAPETAWRSRWSLEMLKRYAGRHVAIKGRRVVADAPTLEALLRIVDERKLGRVFLDRIEEPVMVVY